MIIEIAEGIFWDDEKLVYQQSDEAQTFIEPVMSTPVIKRTYKTCLSDKMRATLRRYQLSENLTLDVIPVYNSSRMARDFMGMSEIIYTINKI